MNDNKATTKSIKDYILVSGGHLKTTFENRMSVWSYGEDVEILLPEDKVIEHRQSAELIIDAIDELAIENGISFNDMEKQIAELEFDTLYVRASGKDIPHGKIKFQEGLKSLEGLYGIIKNSANKSINISGKTKLVEQYLDGVNLLAPEKGSFIYRAEMELTEVADDSSNNSLPDTESLGRYLNGKLAKQMWKTQLLLSQETTSPAALIREGIDLPFCDNFLKLFSNSSEQLDFRFNWSIMENIDESLPIEIVFKLEDKTKVKGFKKILKETRTMSNVDFPAVIEGNNWAEDADEGTVNFRVNIEGGDYTCSYNVDNTLYAKLKSQPPKTKVTISGDLLVTRGKQTKAEILKINEIVFGQEQKLPIEQLSLKRAELDSLLSDSLMTLENSSLSGNLMTLDDSFITLDDSLRSTPKKNKQLPFKK